MKRILSVLYVTLLLACQPQEPTKKLPDVTVLDRSLLSGPDVEVALIKNFPLAFYKIYQIDGLGAFYLDSRSDIIKDELRKGKPWEANIAELMQKYTRENSTAIDIGAHIGTHTLSLAKFVGEKGSVVAFEPQLKLFSELVMNMNLNGCNNVTAYRCALGDMEKRIEMSPAYPGNEGGTGIGFGGDHAKMVLLDAFELDNVSFIKMDVENFEYEVLLGAEKTILKNKPVMIIEIMGNIYQPIPNRNEKVAKTLQWLEDRGYKLEYIDGSWSDWIAIPL